MLIEGKYQSHKEIKTKIDEIKCEQKFLNDNEKIIDELAELQKDKTIFLYDENNLNKLEEELNSSRQNSSF